jgi:dTDP-4-dehydrorhamnose reductase
MRILLTGKNGQVGAELQRALPVLGEIIALGRQELDLASPDAICRTVRDTKPDIIVNAAAYTAVDRAESEPELAMAINGTAPGILAEEARQIGAFLVHYSTDYVFDGTKDTPYTEDDVPNPLNAYGHSKLAGENAIRASGVSHYVFRTSWVYASHGHNFLNTILRLARERSQLRIVDDQMGAPTWARTIAEATVQALMRRTSGHIGLYHLAASGTTTWFGFAEAILAEEGKMRRAPQIPRLIPIRTSEYPVAAKRPASSRLDTTLLTDTFGIRPVSWQASLVQCLRELQRPVNT